MAFEDTRPIQLRPTDQADDVPALLLDMADLLRQINTEATYVVHTLGGNTPDVARRLSKAHATALDIREAVGRLQTATEGLSKALRATGRM